MPRSIALVEALLILATPFRAEFAHVDSAGHQRLPAAGAAGVGIRTAEEWSETGMMEGSYPLTFFGADGGHDIGARLRTLAAIAGAGHPVAAHP